MTFREFPYCEFCYSEGISTRVNIEVYQSMLHDSLILLGNCARWVFQQDNAFAQSSKSSQDGF